MDSIKNDMSITIIQKFYGLINVSNVITCDGISCHRKSLYHFHGQELLPRRPLNLAPYPKLVPVLLYS